MTSLLFLLTFLALLVLLITLIVKASRRKPVRPIAKLIAFVIGGYAGLWVIFQFISGYLTVPLGTDTCFDDWCATVNKVEIAPGQLPAPPADSIWIVLHVKMSNQARGIAQKPSEPRAHLIDGRGGYWAVSDKGQQALEKTAGEQPDIGSRLELHQSLETQLVFAIPAKVKKVKALIEEGPAITKLLLPEDRQVYDVIR